jgi:hypothetical protein
MTDDFKPMQHTTITNMASGSGMAFAFPTMHIDLDWMRKAMNKAGYEPVFYQDCSREEG